MSTKCAVIPHLEHGVLSTISKQDQDRENRLHHQPRLLAPSCAPRPVCVWGCPGRKCNETASEFRTYSERGCQFSSAACKTLGCFSVFFGALRDIGDEIPIPSKTACKVVCVLWRERAREAGGDDCCYDVVLLHHTPNPWFFLFSLWVGLAKGQDHAQKQGKARGRGQRVNCDLDSRREARRGPKFVIFCIYCKVRIGVRGKKGWDL